jgi:hypothetical protein
MQSTSLEASVRRILTFGPKAQDQEFNATLFHVVGGTFLTIMTLPVLSVPAMMILYASVKNAKSKKFEWLALDDKRFELFIHLAKEETEKANTAFEENKKFFVTITKTYAFMTEFVKCLENCDNDLESNRDREKGNRFLDFFITRGLIDCDFNRYRLELKEFPDSGPDMNPSD